MSIEKIGAVMLEYVVPIIILLFIVIAFVATKQKNIAINAIGFLLIMLSIFMSGTPNFVPETSFVNCGWYKALAMIFGLLGTSICAIVAFKDQV